MESLLELLTIDDLKNKIVSTKEYTNNIKRYAYQMKAFWPLFEQTWDLPIKHAKYHGKICYIDWILRSDELYLGLNVTYYKTGLIKSVEGLSQQLTLVELGDLRNIKTLAGKRFKKKYVYNRKEMVYSVIGDRIISPKPFAIVQGGMERFANREKILKRFGYLQSVPNGI
jgi:hypothetical protein